MFRGIRQHSTGIALWPVADLGVAVYSGRRRAQERRRQLRDAGTACTPATRARMVRPESCGTNRTSTQRSGLGFGGGASLATTYTAYTSPNNAFTTVKELMFKLGVDDSAYLGKAALKPYALVAFEFDTEPGVGQADGGANAGPVSRARRGAGYAGAKASLAVPVKVGPQPRELLRAEHRNRRGAGLRRQHVRLLQRRRPGDGAARRHDRASARGTCTAAWSTRRSATRRKR